MFRKIKKLNIINNIIYLNNIINYIEIIKFNFYK